MGASDDGKKPLDYEAMEKGIIYYAMIEYKVANGCSLEASR